MLGLVARVGGRELYRAHVLGALCSRHARELFPDASAFRQFPALAFASFSTLVVCNTSFMAACCVNHNSLNDHGWKKTNVSFSE